jgi:hypothetical protein
MLAAMAFEDPSRFAATFRAPTGVTYLQKLWDGLGRELPQETRVSGSTASIELTDEIILLRLPEPCERNEAFAVAVAFGGEGPRVFLLERSEIPSLPHIRAMVAEVSPNKRSNLGPLDDTDNAAFIARVREIIEPG